MKNFFLVSITCCYLVFSQAVFSQAIDTGYDSKGKRDPFIPLITQKVKAAAGLEAIETIDDVILEGIVWDAGGKSVAILNGSIVKEKDKVGGVKIEKIEKKRIILYIYGVKSEIALGEEKEGKK